MSVMQRLYDSKITRWSTRSWDEVESWLDEQARIHYPDSFFARSTVPRE